MLLIDGGAGDRCRPAVWTVVPWSARFDEPIVLPDGGDLVTLRDAGEHIQ
jgi:hypothetical protein